MKNNTFKYGEMTLTSGVLYAHCKDGNLNAMLSDKAKDQIVKYRAHVEKIIASNTVCYGVNTGVGFLSNITIDDDKLDLLQLNVVRSHACGTGNYVSKEVSRGLLFLRAHTFALGYSGISLACVNTIVKHLEKDILPAVPSQGSVGASGDLVPLSHMALAIIGEGEVFYHNELKPAKEVLKSLDVKPYKLKPKEGLSLINGTHFMTVLAAFAVEEAKILSRAADVIGALSLSAIKGSLEPFDQRIHAIRPHKGQSIVAQNFRAIFKDSEQHIHTQDAYNRVQDPYSFRCIPQVHGAVRDAIDYASEKVNIELNSVTDNPLCCDNGDIISNGNFHGEPVALAMDFLGIAMTDIGSISERRTEKLTNPSTSGLPPFVIKESGLNSGFMIPHVVSAALTSENKFLSHPASVDSIPTSADKEDHVSMGPISARKARDIIKSVSNILAIELLIACQAKDLSGPFKSEHLLSQIFNKVREISPFIEKDRSLHKDIEKVSEWIISGGIDDIVKHSKSKLN